HPPALGDGEADDDIAIRRPYRVRGGGQPDCSERQSQSNTCVSHAVLPFFPRFWHTPCAPELPQVCPKPIGRTRGRPEIRSLVQVARPADGTCLEAALDRSECGPPTNRPTGICLARKDPPGIVGSCSPGMRGDWRGASGKKCHVIGNMPPLS